MQNKMGSIKKTDLICLICNKLLLEPIHLPCTCTICHKHLKDNTVKNGFIKCEICQEEFCVKNIEIKVNKLAKIVLDAGDFLSDEDKELKSQFNGLLNRFQNYYDQFIQNKNNTEIVCHEHYSELSRQVDIHREELKMKIN